MKRLLSLFLLASLTMAGCSHIPTDIRQAPTGDPQQQQVSIEPARHINAQVRWGGTIAAIRNKPEQTELEVVGYPLRWYGRPRTYERSTGRFQVTVQGFLDPAVYGAGREVTITGRLAGTTAGKIGAADYTYPIVNASRVHLWQPYYDYYPSYYYGLSFGYGHRFRHGFRFGFGLHY